ncbi:MAG TPA: hypothetical protein DCF86_07860 [Dehalococcoidia bacterium]|nr:hypothetical protein [Dehalococcoidia bacterium]|tara:strand:- start:39 stop:239 length:201 start_codon:yes stop_codon:yes gene_type:complete
MAISLSYAFLWCSNVRISKFNVFYLFIRFVDDRYNTFQETEKLGGRKFNNGSPKGGKSRWIVVVGG